MSNSYLAQICIELTLVVICLSIWLCFCSLLQSAKERGITHYLWFLLLGVVGLLIFDLLAIWFRGNVTTAGYYIVRISNFLVLSFCRGLVLYTAFYVDRYLRQMNLRSRVLAIVKCMSSVSIMLLVLNLFVPFLYSFDSSNRYYRMSGYTYLAAVDTLWTILLWIVILRNRKKWKKIDAICLLCTIGVPVLAAVAQVFCYGISLLVIMIPVTQFVLFLVSYQSLFQELIEKDKEISEYNTRLVLTQLQPHFLLNSLSAVQYLCNHEPEEAAETIGDLNVYIRDNMEFLQSMEMIPFDRELKHIEKYIAIERKRFGDRIRIEMDIREKDFMIPPLSVQPLVENAVKHGISKKRDGGTVKLSTWRDEESLYIKVEDDGVGYDVAAHASSDRPHMGMKIVRDRLEKWCEGRVHCSSSVGEGTVVTICLPIEIQ